MHRLKNQSDFENALKRYLSQKDESIKNYIETRNFSGYAETEDLVIIEDLTIENIEFWGISFECLQFRKCKFNNISFFRDVSIGACIFFDCEFHSVSFSSVHFSECDFISTRFFSCKHDYNIFGDCLFKDTKFLDSREMLEIYFGGCKTDRLEFQNCFFTHSRFEDFRNDEINIFFNDCIIETTYFFQLDLKESRFTNTLLNQNSFSDCFLATDTIDSSTYSTAKEYSSIDFQSIIKSSNINGSVLKQCFGIESADIKEYIFGLTQKIKFQSVFISYSFNDKIFANRLSNSLKSKGVFTFLWEKDAPGGKGLKKIMKENIQKFDRILFIASENSIRSKACQFELTEGRKKQAELWIEIFFPIHIDDYLFTVEKDDIKPNSVQDEYWENICELKEINSMDFKSFRDRNFNQEDYDNLIFKLVKELKK